MSGRLLALDVAAEGDESAVCIYDSPLPSFIDSELERLHRNVFSSVTRLRSQGRLQQVSAYVVRSGGRVTSLLLFRREGQAVRVLNEAIALEQAEIEAFSRTVFESYSGVGVVCFEAIQCRIGRLPYPYQRFNCLEDIVLDLPTSAEAYFSALGKNMRASLKRYQKKIAVELKGLQYTVHEGRDVSEQLLADIVALSSARIASKHQASSHTDQKTAELARLVRACGVVLVASIDGRVCGGVICTRFGGNFFMHVVAHDPRYDDYRLGKICCYLSICDAIGRGGREYHFLWGKYDYKYRLLGVQRDLDRVVVYRSRLSLLLNGVCFLHTAWRGYGRRTKHWLRDEQNTGGKLAQWVRAAWRRTERAA
jgi:hypothetical protein